MSFLPRFTRSVLVVGSGTAAYVAATSSHSSSSYSFTERSSPVAAPSDCEEIACSDKKSLLFSSFQKAQGKKPTRVECPLNRAELGKSTWELLHTTAAYYPDKPTEAEKQAAKDLVNGIAVLYPCTHCRAHFAKEVEEDPPDVSTRDAFSKWLCQRHNNVNKWLEKPQFDCSAESLQVRWRRGKKQCHVLNDGEEETAESSLGQD